MTELTSIVTTVIATATSMVTFVTATPILLIPIAFGLIGGSVALFKRLT